jgi:hypothetical protein
MDKTIKASTEYYKYCDIRKEIVKGEMALTVFGVIEQWKRINAQQTYLERELKLKIERREEQIVRLKKRLTKQRKAYISWVDGLVKPIAELLVKEFPDRYYEILEFPLGSTTAIHFYRNGVTKENMYEKDNCLSIRFRPGDLKTGELFAVDTNTNTGEYGKNTVGEINGFNFPSVKVELKVKWLMDFIKEHNKNKT